jgi:hypothetical protein
VQIITDLETLNKAMTPDKGNPNYEGMFCIKTVPYTCSCSPDKVWDFAHLEKKIVVWNEKDEDSILDLASQFKRNGYDPKIIEYKVMFGKAIHWDDIPDGEYRMA